MGEQCAIGRGTVVFDMFILPSKTESHLFLLAALLRRDASYVCKILLAEKNNGMASFRAIVSSCGQILDNY